MPSPTKAYAALREALVDAKPSCAGDDRFTSETANAADLAPLCRSCPVFDACHALAVSSDRPPVWGVLAGIARRHSNPMLGTGPGRVAEIYG
ncbi:WhiB family transcriptional regulator [Microbacterium sp. NPDC007973]|uniref:WhiB family transcriptional regulator n=1 Tax=Microbacterium sp. NPDC007973 TaxID=3364182 RepID=UPI0036EA2683